MSRSWKKEALVENICILCKDITTIYDKKMCRQCNLRCKATTSCEWGSIKWTRASDGDGWSIVYHQENPPLIIKLD